ncbi:MAG: HypC/HybG/HupF family hydrogenase formation chaperone [Lachnospiraceae bacterium]|nr:HypC/HybG/HupF family hydrogenase formation chaperone [Lachnospiraceae bacterium]
MCVALPGTVISVEGRQARVDFSGNIVEADTTLVETKPGDRVLLHAGCIIQRLSLSDATEMDDFMKMIREMEGGPHAV